MWIGLSNTFGEGINDVTFLVNLKTGHKGDVQQQTSLKLSLFLLFNICVKHLDSLF